MRQSGRMLRTKWKPEDYHRALKHFEEEGCHFSMLGSADLLSVPGWDAHFFAGSPAFAEFASRWLWDRLEIKLAADSASFSLRWIYWTPLQTSLHFFVTLMILLSPLSLNATLEAVVAGNLIPVIATLGTCWRVQSRFEKAGFKRLVW